MPLPSGIPYDRINLEDMVVMDTDGNIVEGERKPSSEWDLHRIFYKNRQDLDAIIHSHTNYATTLACMGKGLPPVHYMIAVAGKNIRLAKYASFGTPELAENAFHAMKDRKAVLLANHGLLAGGKTLEEAFNITEQIEYVSGIYLRTLAAGKPVILDDDEMEIMLEKFKTYGQ